jgi:peptide/nickel transport system substrate-binding protein
MQRLPVGALGDALDCGRIGLPATLDFALRPGVKFHDGSPLTADDVLYTLTVASDPASKGCTPANYNWIEKAEKTRELAVRVKLTRANPAALEYFALVIPIYPKVYRERVGAQGYAKAPVGAGPYKITKVEPDVSIDVERLRTIGLRCSTTTIPRRRNGFLPKPATPTASTSSSRAMYCCNGVRRSRTICWRSASGRSSTRCRPRR